MHKTTRILLILSWVKSKKKYIYVQYYWAINLGRNTAYRIQRNKTIVKMTIRP